MQFKLYTDVNEFYSDTYDVLMRHEAQNMIPLGNIIIGNEGKDKTDWRDPVNWLMANVSNENGIQLTALMTPPHNITLYATDNIINLEAINCLVDGLRDHDIPGVTTEKSLAMYFAEEYAARKGLIYKTSMEQRIHELRVVDSHVKQRGVVRLHEVKYMHSLPYSLERLNAANQYSRIKTTI